VSVRSIGESERITGSDALRINMSAWPNSIVTSAADKQMLISLLDDSRTQFLGSFAGVSDAQSRQRPADDCWSILDTVEHICAAETHLFNLLAHSRRPRNANAPNREAIFMRALPDRSRKMQSPEPGIPTGRFTTLGQAAAHFRTVREEVIQFVTATQEDLRATEVTHPHPLAGNVSSFEMVIIIAKHAERHALQIEEIKNSPAYCAQAAQG
jgi:uncharacterized damage-inducible protein DinB